MNAELGSGVDRSFRIHHSAFTIPCLTVALLVQCSVLRALAAQDASAAVGIEVVRIDGRTVQGDLIGSSDGRSLELRTADGPQTIPLDGLTSIAFDMASTRQGSSPGQPTMPVVFHLADGGRLYGQLLTPTADNTAPTDKILAQTSWGNAVALPFDRLAGIQLVQPGPFTRAFELFRSALSARLPGQDVLVTRSTNEAKAVRGRLETLDVNIGAFVFGHRTRTIETQKIFGIVFAAGVAPGESLRHQATVTLVDGSVFSGRLKRISLAAGLSPAAGVSPAAGLLPAAGVSPAAGLLPAAGADGGSLRFATSLGFAADLPLCGATRTSSSCSPSAVAGIRIHSDRVVYVSDLSPSSRRIEGRLHRHRSTQDSRPPQDSRSPQEAWPVRFDTSVSRAPLSMAGRTFAKGIGVHSYAELVYEIGGAYEAFVATIGIDDVVRPRGSVVFRVEGDGKVLFDSGMLTGTDPPQDIIVNISGVTILTLVVDYGDELDLADHADWGDARLLKPQKLTETGTS